MSLPIEVVQFPGRSGWWTHWYDARRRRARWKKLAETRQLALKALHQLQCDLTAGVYDRRYARLTMGEYYTQHYRDDFLTNPDRRTWHGKERHMIEQYILPTFSSTYMDGITLYAAESWYRKMDAGGLARRYSKHIVECFKRMLTRAEGKFIEVNPIRRLKVLHPDCSVPESLTRNQVGYMARTLTGRDRLMFVLWIHTGLRKEEMSFLQWADIDMTACKLQVKAKDGHTIKDREERYIDLTADVMNVLREHRAGRRAEDYVFTSPRGERIADLTHYVLRMFRRAGVKGNALLLRHTFASMALSGGVVLAELKQYMGHSSIKITEQHYACFLPGNERSIHKVDFGMKSGSDYEPTASTILRMDGKEVVA